VVLLAKQTNRICEREKVLFLAPNYVRAALHIVQTVVLVFKHITVRDIYQKWQCWGILLNDYFPEFVSGYSWPIWRKP
jgi:hypothetical protein